MDVKWGNPTLCDSEKKGSNKTISEEVDCYSLSFKDFNTGTAEKFELQGIICNTSEGMTVDKYKDVYALKSVKNLCSPEPVATMQKAVIQQTKKKCVYITEIRIRILKSCQEET